MNDLSVTGQHNYDLTTCHDCIGRKAICLHFVVTIWCDNVIRSVSFFKTSVNHIIII